MMRLAICRLSRGERFFRLVNRWYLVTKAVWAFATIHCGRCICRWIEGYEPVVKVFYQGAEFDFLHDFKSRVMGIVTRAHCH
jgi:hypothetical protein